MFYFAWEKLRRFLSNTQSLTVLHQPPFFSALSSNFFAPSPKHLQCPSLFSSDALNVLNNIPAPEIFCARRREGRFYRQSERFQQKWQYRETGGESSLSWAKSRGRSLSRAHRQGDARYEDVYSSVRY